MISVYTQTEVTAGAERVLASMVEGGHSGPTADNVMWREEQLLRSALNRGASRARAQEHLRNLALGKRSWWTQTP